METEEGRVLNPTGTPNYEYTLTDHLGNNRVTFDSSTGAGSPKQQDDYYPFGLEISRVSPGNKNHYLYNKKELQDELTQYDYGARFYDPVVGRFTTIDPKAEISRRFSPYTYGDDNSIRNIDPDGMETMDSGGDGGLGEHGTGNDMSLIENIFYSTKDAVTSGVGTMVSMVKSWFTKEPVKEASFDYSGGSRQIKWNDLSTTGDKVTATGNAFLGIASIIPIDGPAAGIFAKASGVKSSVATIVKEAVHANSKASTLENTLYKLETTEGKYLKTGITSKAPIEKDIAANFLKINKWYH